MASLIVLLFIIVTSVVAIPVEELYENRLKTVEEEDIVSTTSKYAGDSSFGQSTDHQDSRMGRGSSEWLSSETKSKSGTSSLKESKIQKLQETPTTSQGLKQTKLQKKGRNHKAIFVDYPFIPQLSAAPNYQTYDDLEGEGRTPGGGGQRKGYQESNIYYIRLPPTPYMFVPGLGYVSQPPTYSTGHLRPPITHLRPQVNPYRPHNVYNSPVNEINPFINVPVDFVSNGKPTGVYQWQSPSYQPTKPRPESQITTLNKGPYFFNGRPQSIYLLRPDDRPQVHQTLHQFPDYQDTNLYY